MSDATIAEVAPASRRAAESFLAAQAVTWGSGRTVTASRDGAIVAALRLLDPNPGDGYHREHVRELVSCGDASCFAEIALAAVALVPATMRLEAECAGSGAWAEALVGAGLLVEGEVPDGVRLFGRPGPERGEPVAAARASAPPIDVRLEWSSRATRPALGRFLASLVAGRAYPPGTLLSESERLETQRDALDGTWLLALDSSGEVAGALVLEPSRRGPPHRNVHLDVRRDARGAGIASALVARAIAEARAIAGAAWLHADPRAGNAGAVGALRRGGMRECARQARAWRMRCGGRSWDEDVLRFAAASL